MSEDINRAIRGVIDAISKLNEKNASQIMGYDKSSQRFRPIATDAEGRIKATFVRE